MDGGTAIAVTFLLLQFEAAVVLEMGGRISYRAGFLAPIFALLLLTISLSESRLIELLKWRPLCILGEACYGLYILQMPVAHLLERYVLQGATLIAPSKHSR